MRPSPARMWNYLQGGKDNYPLDRQVGDQMAERFPDIVDMARGTRLLLMRGVNYLAEAGVRQFLDIGCGLPAPHPFKNTHEIAQEVSPECRVVYVDSDVVVMSHARALLTSGSGYGTTDYVESDIRQTDHILAEAAKTLDFGEPVGVLLLGVLGAIGYDEALGAVARLKDAVPSGSYLLHEDGVALTRERQAAVDQRNETGMNRYELRGPEQFERFYAGWELIEPELVSVAHWRPTVISADKPPVEDYCALARKP
jgi:S-adenosyl methyltransferase